MPLLLSASKGIATSVDTTGEYISTICEERTICKLNESLNNFVDIHESDKKLGKHCECTVGTSFIQEDTDAGVVVKCHKNF